MSTNDVPGFNPDNGDHLAMGCWAEHSDGSLVFVESTEGGSVVYSVFDISKMPIIEYRDTKKVNEFSETFTYMKRGDIQWLWHDKTPFPWDRIINLDGSKNSKFANVSDQINSASQIADSLKLRAKERNPEDFNNRIPQIVQDIKGKIGKALSRLGK